MNNSIKILQDAWNSRERKLGNTKRAVLFKRFPALLNNYIHKRHISFIKNNLPDYPNKLLDAGCGFGRVSSEIKKIYPNTKFHGVELCSNFAKHYNENLGPCYNGAIQDFKCNDKFDVILIVTLLMYLDQFERVDVLDKLWEYLSPGGVIISIEPAIEILNLWRRLTGKVNASPTGGEVYYFNKDELLDLFTSFSDAHVNDTMSLSLITRKAALHHGVVITKSGSNKKIS